MRKRVTKSEKLIKDVRRNTPQVFNEVKELRKENIQLYHRVTPTKVYKEDRARKK